MSNSLIFARQTQLYSHRPVLIEDLVFPFSFLSPSADSGLWGQMLMVVISSVVPLKRLNPWTSALHKTEGAMIDELVKKTRGRWCMKSHHLFIRYTETRGDKKPRGGPRRWDSALEHFLKQAPASGPSSEPLTPIKTECHAQMLRQTIYAGRE